MVRPLTAGETTLARSVFADAIALERVRLHAGGFGRFAVTLGSRIFLPAHLAQCDFASTDAHAQALLVHELVHVWQFQRRPGWTLRSWAGVVASGGYGPDLLGYRYALPVPAFDTLNLEQQASVVEHAFLLGRDCSSGTMPAGLRLSDFTGVAPFPSRAD